MALIINQNNKINECPLAIFSEIFGYLSPEDLGRASRVCKLWNNLALEESLWKKFDLKTLFTKLSILDQSVWEAHVDVKALGLSFDDAGPLDNRKVIPQLKRLFAKLRIEGDAGITLLTIPKGHSINKIREIEKASKIDSYSLLPLILPENIVQSAYRVAITNNVLEMSKNMPALDLFKLVENYGCTAPKLIEITSLAILTFISSTTLPPLRLLSDNPERYTFSMEKLNNVPLKFGKFAVGSYDYGSLGFIENIGIVARQAVASGVNQNDNASQETINYKARKVDIITLAYSSDED